METENRFHRGGRKGQTRALLGPLRTRGSDIEAGTARTPPGVGRGGWSRYRVLQLALGMPAEQVAGAWPDSGAWPEPREQ